MSDSIAEPVSQQEDSPSQQQQAISIWHRLIPGAALTFHSVLEAVVDRVVGPADGCVSPLALWARTISFLLAWVFGLSVMKWSNFSHGNVLWHGAVNVVVVTAWLLAISQYPLACWAGHAGSLGYDLTTQESHSIGLTRLVLVAVMEAATALEIHSFVTNSRVEEDTKGGGSSSSVAGVLEEYLPSIFARGVLKWYHKAWRRHVPGVALTLQATLASGIEAAYGASPNCSGASAVWRTIAFTIAWAMGTVSMCSEVVTTTTTRKSLMLGILVRAALTLAWLLSVSEVPLQCWISDSMVGTLRLVLTVAVIALAGLTEKMEENNTETTGLAATVTNYGAIAATETAA